MLFIRLHVATASWKPERAEKYKSFLGRYMDAGYFCPTDKMTIPDTTHPYNATPYSLLVRAVAARNVLAVEVLLERGAFEAPDLRDELIRVQKDKWNLIPARTPPSLEEAFRLCVDYAWEAAAPDVMPRLTAAIMRGRIGVVASGQAAASASTPAPARRARVL